MQTKDPKHSWLITMSMFEMKILVKPVMQVLLYLFLQMKSE